MESESRLSVLLERVQDGDRQAAGELLPMVYGELRRLARAMMSRELLQTPQPTELVHEAYLRLGGDRGAPWRNRAHYFAAAAEAMRRILVDRARRRGRLKHGGGQRRVPLSRARVEWDCEPEEVLDVTQALDRLEELDRRVARVVTLRYFAGLTVPETAAALEVSPRTVKRDWSRAKVWLYRELGRSSH